MGFDTHAGTRGLPMTANRLDTWMNRQMARRSIRRLFGRFGFKVAVLTTVGHRSRLERRSQVCWFPGGHGSWLIVAAAGGTRVNPAWYHNIAANPDEVYIDIDGDVVPVTAEQLQGAEREQAWREVTAAARRFARFQEHTDREFPILRLTPRQGHGEHGG